jgi:hypothetical protein
MPTFDDPHHEGIAQARAKGERLDNAYEGAGLVLCKGDHSRIARRPEAAERIAELRRMRVEVGDVRPERVIAGLLRVAKAGETSRDVAPIEEARLALLDAVSVDGLEGSARRQDHLQIIDESGHQAGRGGHGSHPMTPRFTCQKPASHLPFSARDLPAASLSPTRRLPRESNHLPATCQPPAGDQPKPARPAP